jgi:hypothetical protein
MSLAYITDQLTVYIGSFLLITGLISNGMNIWIFSSVRTYRKTPSTFYYLIESIINTIYISMNLITRIVTSSNGFDLTLTSLAWYKSRAFFLGSLAPISYTCSCLAIIDQFFLTSQKVHIRRLSNINRTYRIVILVIIVWCIHGGFAPFFYNITPTRCMSTNALYANYTAIYVIVISCAIPVIVIMIFGYLTYQNLHQTIVLAAEHADDQLTKMILIQLILFIISIIPYGINTTYRLITSEIPKDLDRQVKENFITIIVTLITYLYFIVCLYLFVE